MLSHQLRAHGHSAPPIPSLLDLLLQACKAIETRPPLVIRKPHPMRERGIANAARAQALITHIGQRELTRLQMQRELHWTESEAKSALSHLRQHSALRVVGREKEGCIYRIGSLT